MNYPNITQYKEAIEFSEDTLKELNHLEPVRRANGELYFSSGNFAVVFKLYDRAADKYYALKCFLRDAPERKVRYVHTHAYISQMNCPYLLACDFLEDEIYADDREIEVLCMEWVEGKLLGVLIRELCEADDHTGLDALYQQFKIMALNISQLDFAHGDIKHDNVIVTESFGYQYTLKLIDYDGMYVPALRGQQAQELGGKSYQHPLRDASHFDKDLDSFSVYLILLSLAVLRERPEWYEAYNSGENILFSQADLLDWENSPLVNNIYKYFEKDQEVAKWLDRVGAMLRYNIVADKCFKYSLYRKYYSIKYYQESMIFDFDDSYFHSLELFLEHLPEDNPLLDADVVSTPSIKVSTDNLIINQLINDMVYVEGGILEPRMNFDQIYDSRDSRHTALDRFFIGRMHVTQAQWEAVMGNNPSYFKGDPNRPVEQVSKNNCHEFIEKLNTLTGLIFTLPTQEQWEFAARGGIKSQGFKYAGSNYINEVAWCDLNSGGSTHPVGQKKPNELGLYDMNGNVWEWCDSIYDDYPISKISNLSESTCEDFQVICGGSWFFDKEFPGIGEFSGCEADSYGSNLGFRLVCTLPSKNNLINALADPNLIIYKTLSVGQFKAYVGVEEVEVLRNLQTNTLFSNAGNLRVSIYNNNIPKKPVFSFVGYENEDPFWLLHEKGIGPMVIAVL